MKYVDLILVIIWSINSIEAIATNGFMDSIPFVVAALGWLSSFILRLTYES